VDYQMSYARPVGGLLNLPTGRYLIQMIVISRHNNFANNAERRFVIFINDKTESQIYPDPNLLPAGLGVPVRAESVRECWINLQWNPALGANGAHETQD
jgi:uncharacterized protein YbdZ (MbtH family)